jgi:hypothetical protein
VPAGVYVENIDLAMSLDRVAFFARRSLKTEQAVSPAQAPSTIKESTS